VRLQAQAQEALDELRSLVFELRPPDLERDGLGGALRKHVELLRRLEQHEIDLVLDGDLPADPARDAEILRIAQEALQNALKHARATHVAVKLGTDDDQLVLEVEDDGVGFDPDAAAARSRRLGLTSMEERARRIGGTLEIRSAPGVGTTVRLKAGPG
jgi:signal transduction histidine kinase